MNFDWKQQFGRACKGLFAGLAVCGVALAQSNSAPLASTMTTSSPYTGYQQINAVAADAAGNIIFTRPDLGQLLEQPANGGAVITLTTGLSYPKGVAVDNLGYAYASDYSGHLWKVPMGGGTPVDILGACNTIDGYYLGSQEVAADGSGNVYVAGNNETTLFRITPAGTCSAVAGATLNDSTNDGMSHVAADAAGDVYYSVGANLYAIYNGTTTPQLVTSNFGWILGLGVDALGNAFVVDSMPDSYTGVVKEVPMMHGALNPAAMFTVLPFFSHSDLGVDAVGRLYTSDGNSLTISHPGVAAFASTAVAATSSSASITVLFTNNATIDTIALTQAGAASSEFINTGAGSCAPGSYTAGSTCTVSVAFKPAAPGLRMAALQLLSSGSVVAQATLSGMGSGAALTLDPGTANSLGSNWNTPAAVAVDAAGNLYVADSAAGTVTRFAAASGSGAVIASGLHAPAALALLPDGSLLVAESGSSDVVELPLAQGTFGAPVVVISGVTSPQALLVDAGGNLYLAAAQTLQRYANTGGFINYAAAQTILSNKTISALTQDAVGNLYLADSSNGRIIKLNGSTQTTLLDSLQAPATLAIDAGGSLYYTQSGSTSVTRVPFANGSYNLNAATTLGSKLNAAQSIALDTNGRLYIAQSGSVLQLDRVAATLQFGKVNVNDSSASIAFTLNSSGDQTLTLSNPLVSLQGNSTDFVLSPVCTAGATLAAGNSCAIAATFAPTANGVRTAQMTVASNATNASTIGGTLVGTGTSLPKTTTTLALLTTGTPSFGQAVQLAATVKSDSGSPTGTVQFLVNGSAYGAPVAITNGVANVSIAGLLAGTNTIAATYSGDASDAASSAQPLSLNIALAATTTTLTSTAHSTTPVAPGTSITLTAQVAGGLASAQPSGSVSFTTGTTVLGTVALGTNGTAALTTSTLPTGTYSVVATYSGDSGFASSSSSSVALAILPPQFVVSNTPTALTTTASGIASTQFTIAPISGYTGGVDLSCSGLPANATCTFTPATVYFASTKDSTGAAVAPGPQTVGLTITTGAAKTTSVAAWLLPLGGLLLFARRRRGILLATVALFFVTLGSGLIGCTASSITTPKGSSTVTVTMTASPSGVSTVPTDGSGNLVKTFTLNLNVQ